MRKLTFFLKSVIFYILDFYRDLLLAAANSSVATHAGIKVPITTGDFNPSGSGHGEARPEETPPVLNIGDEQ